MLKKCGLRAFKLRAVVLWTIHNSGYVVFVGVAHQGHVACPVCGPCFKGEHSLKIGKQTYTNTKSLCFASQVLPKYFDNHDWRQGHGEGETKLTMCRHLATFLAYSPSKTNGKMLKHVVRYVLTNDIFDVFVSTIESLKPS